MDNLYTQSVLKMKAKELLDNEEKKKKVQELLNYTYWDKKDKNLKCLFIKPKVERNCMMRLIIISYWITKFIYKTIYFYLLPYFIIPLSYYSFID